MILQLFIFIFQSERNALHQEIYRNDVEPAKEDTLANLVTYQSDLVSREWRSADGVTAPVYQPPGLCDDMVCEPVNCAYSKAILCESELPPVHVRDKKKVGGPSPGVGGTLGPVLSPPNLSTQLSPSILGDFKPKIRREDLLASAPRSLQ